MSQRHSGRARLARDAYNTPAWVTRVLVEDLEREQILPLVSKGGEPLAIWEPAAGDGLMASALSDAGYEVYGSDIDGQAHNSRCDFMTETLWPAGTPPGIGAIITNPPYKNVDQWVTRALDLMAANHGLVALLLKVDFDSAGTRRHLFAEHPAWRRKIVLTDRIHWIEDPEGRAGPSENHAWFVWRWRPRANDLDAAIGYAAMPPTDKAALRARMAERRAAAKARQVQRQKRG